MSFSSILEIADKPELLKAYKDALSPETNFKQERATYSLTLKKDKLQIL